MNLQTLTEIVTTWMAPRRGEMESLLERLVNIDSGSDDKNGNDAVADAIEGFLQGPGIALSRVPKAATGDILVAIAEGGTGAPVLLLGHRDTVFPTGTAAKRPFTRLDDLAFGPGVADMKGGLVVIAFVLKALAACGGAPFPVIAVLNADEEVGSADSRTDIEAMARGARAVLCMEPGRASGNVVSVRKGGVMIEIRVAGRAAHAGANHADGRSAIEALARKVVRLHALTDYGRGITTNVGTIAGGETHNTVAPWAIAKLDIRFRDTQQWPEIQAVVADILSAQDVPDTRTDWNVRPLRLPLTEATSRDLLARYQAATAELGFAVEGEITGGCADSGFTSALGIPTLCGLGPVGNKVHTEAEVCRLDTLVPRAQAAALSILSLVER